MRKFLFTFLLATTAVATTAVAPAAAQTEESNPVRERAERKAERAEARAQRAEAQERRSDRAERRSQVREPRAIVRERPERPAEMERRVQSERTERRAQVRERIRERSDGAGDRPLAGERRIDRTERRQERAEQRRDNPGLFDSLRDRRDLTQRIIDSRENRRVVPPPGARPDRPAPPPETVSRRDRHPEWRRDWRRDHRYDWRRWRDHNRSRFHIGFYFDPFGWNYRRYGIGWRLWPSYYSNRYWLNDPWSYRLPYAPWPYQWVRYWDDALLVNTRTGEVVDVIYDFFW